MLPEEFITLTVAPEPEVDGGPVGPSAQPSQPLRVAIIGTYAPRKCGIATFTSDIVEQAGRFHPEISLDVHALDNPAEPHIYERGVAPLRFDDAAAYVRAADAINASGAAAVWVQHEYGIFGGPDGEMVCEFVDRLAAPLILTLHTVLSRPSERQRAIMAHLVARASRIMVMSRHSRDLLEELYGVPRDLVAVIEHGAPDRPFGRSAHFKQALGIGDRPVLMTFGLLGPGKGLEQVIEALPTILERHPNVLYRIVGATHPGLVAREGETYREGLLARAEELGVAHAIAWENRFLDTPELLDQLEACDIYVTPYHNLQQSTSGTLSYAVALGKAVVSTPYIHARELLANGVGELIEPDSPAAIAAAVTELLDDPARLVRVQRRAWERGRETIWPRFAGAVTGLVRSVARPLVPLAPLGVAPSLEGVFAMSDATGMYQHAVGIVPDRNHGYCLDDNVRALMLMNLADPADLARCRTHALSYAAFTQHAWNPDIGRFRNFMNFDRTWCEDAGSEDSNGRAMWALGHTIERSPIDDLQVWAGWLFDRSLPDLSAMRSPRARAFAVLGCCAVLRRQPDHAAAAQLVEEACTFLAHLLEKTRIPGWVWFEDRLGYDNPRLCQALIEGGVALSRRDWVRDGIESLRWLARRQTSASGQFRPVGSQTFGRAHDSLPFDQQPLEAQAAIEAARAAWQADRGREWPVHGLAAWRWFFGANDRGVTLADMATGRCRDGINPRGRNENCGAESILAFHLARHAMLALHTQGLKDTTGDTIESRERHAGHAVPHL